MLVLFLENHVETLAKVLKANPRYLKNAIRAGLRDKASVTPTTVEIGGESAPAWRVVTKPFDGDPNKERMRGLDGLTYSFVAADKVPGEIQSISIEAVGADGTRLFSESVTYDADCLVASSPSSSPPRPAPASAPRRRSRTIIRRTRGPTTSSPAWR